MPPAHPTPRQPLLSWGKAEEEPKAAAAGTIPKRTAVTKQKAPTRATGERDDV